jgi:type VI protein secretion system component Hcp
MAIATDREALATIFKPLPTKIRPVPTVFIFSKFENFRISQIKLKLNETKLKPTFFCLLITNPSVDFIVEDLLLRFERIKWRAQKTKMAKLKIA